MNRTLKSYVNKTFFLLICLASLNQCAPPGGGSEAKDSNAFPIAFIGHKAKVNYTDLLDRLNHSDLLMHGGILDSTTYFDTLQSMVIDSVVSVLSKTVDFRKDLSAYRYFMQRYIQFWSQYVYQKEVLGVFRVDSSDIDSFYHAHADNYTYQEQVRARQITISANGLRFGYDSVKYRNYSEDQLDSTALQIITEIKNRADTGEDFGTLAYDYSMHKQSGKRNGELGYFVKGLYSKQIDSVAFSLPVGEISDPFKDRDGWHIFEVLDHIDSGLAPLKGHVYEQAKNDYLYEITQRRSKEFIDSLVQEATYVFNDSALNQANLYAIPDTTWSVIINGRDTVDFLRVGDLMGQYHPAGDQDELSLSSKKEILKSYCSSYLLAQYAEDKKLDQEPKAKKELEDIRRAAALKLIFKSYQDPDYMPDDSAIEDYYQRNIDKFTFPKPVYVQHIIVQDSVFGEYLRDLALSGMDFMDLAEENYPGEPEIRRAAADLGYIGPGEMPPEFYDMALKTPKGEVSHPVKTELGYHIIKVVDRKDDRDVVGARHDIVLALREERKQTLENKWRHDMLNKFDVKYDISRIPTIQLLPKDVRDPDAAEK